LFFTVAFILLLALPPVAVNWTGGGPSG